MEKKSRGIIYLHNEEDLKLEALYQAIVAYFGNPEMYKIKNINNYSMYICKIESHLLIEYKYLIVFVQEDVSEINSKVRLFDLKWVSLQTRVLPDEYDIPNFSYFPRRYTPLLNKITLSHKDQKGYKYMVEKYPVSVTILPMKSEPKQTGTLVEALESYNTILTMNLK